MLQCGVRVLLDEQHGGAFGFDLVNRAEDRLADDGREAEGGFVKEQQLRVRHQGASHGQHLLFAAGKRPGALLDPFLEAREQREPTLEVALDGGFVFREIRPHLEVLEHREVCKHAAPLG